MVLASLILLTASCGKKVELTDYEFGGEFELNSIDGGRFRLSDLRGGIVLLFFGYTTCPDVCPSTFSKMKRVSELLGEDSKKVSVIFITVDPDRDTPEKMREYLGYFDPGMKVYPLTGSEQKIKEVAKSYNAAFMKVGTGPDSTVKYLVEHTSVTYLIDGDGKIRYLFKHEADAEFMAGGIRQLL
jgi:protein SCO1/2